MCPERAFGLWAILWLLLASGLGHASDEGPIIPPASFGDQCVADTEIMRKQHMSLLNHQRDETVIEGVRGNPFSLVGCVNCHAQKDDNGQAIRIDAEGQFCESCHAYAAVKIDCFSCHAALPEEGFGNTHEVIGLNTPVIAPLAAADPAKHFSHQQRQVLQSHRVAAGPHNQLRGNAALKNIISTHTTEHQRPVNSDTR